MVLGAVGALRDRELALLVTVDHSRIERPVLPGTLEVLVQQIEVGHRLVFACILRRNRNARRVSHRVSPSRRRHAPRRSMTSLGLRGQPGIIRIG